MSALGLTWATNSSGRRSREWGVIGLGHGETLVVYLGRYGQIDSISAYGRAVTEADRVVLHAACERARTIAPSDRSRRYGAGMSAHRLRFCKTLVRELNRGDDAPNPTSGT